MPELFVTNYNRNFTGVSATAANVVRQQVNRHELVLVGQPLPGCPVPLTRAAAGRITRKHPPKTAPSPSGTSAATPRCAARFGCAMCAGRISGSSSPLPRSACIQPIHAG
ncbi:hypothetical protein [Sulfitobacter profundi]|uniref:Uncharacterized protein n=1 Tax=Sulfitobacter profundi TaxID=2679961 RepID=A0ABW1YZA4_9RHOB